MFFTIYITEFTLQNKIKIYTVALYFAEDRGLKKKSTLYYWIFKYISRQSVTCLLELGSKKAEVYIGPILNKMASI